MRRIILGASLVIAASCSGNDTLTGPSSQPRGTIAVNITVSNKFGGTAIASDFGYTVSGAANFADRAPTLSMVAGNYTLSLDTTIPAGYGASSCSVAVTAYATATCSLVANELAQTCDANIRKFVYANANDERLRKMPQGCITITGWFKRCAFSGDGDLVCDFAVDPPFAYLLNSFNFSRNNGSLVIEFICQGDSKDPPVSVDICKAYAALGGPKYSLPSNEILAVSPLHGKLTIDAVTDMNGDHLWNEGHPTYVKIDLPR